MSKFHAYLKSSIGKKQIVATTGLMLILFLVGHLFGNTFIYFGPEAFNHYAEKLANLRPGLLVVEAGLAVIFFIHIWVTALIVLENINARKQRYAVSGQKGEKSLATKLMPYTGSIILIFVIYHLLDFTFTDKEGARSILMDGQSYGLYGVVYNAFLNPWHALFYIIAMCCLGFHLAHGTQSFLQTFGFNNPQTFSKIRGISNLVGIAIALLYSLIPITIYFQIIGP